MRQPTILERDEWEARHRDRRFISASQVPAILGYDKRESPFSLHQKLTGHLPWPDHSDALLAFDMGHAAEGPLGRAFERETGIPVVDPGEYAIWTHPDLPWFYASLDLLAEDSERGTGNLECKTTEAWAEMARDWRNLDDAPMNVQCQMQAQFACSLMTWGAMLGCIGRGWDGLITKCAEPHDEFIALMMSQLDEFHWRLEKDIAPAVDGSPATTGALKDLHPHAGEDVLDLTGNRALIEEAALRITLRNDAVDAEAEAKARREEQENWFREIIGKHAGVAFDGMTVKLPEIQRSASITIPLNGLDEVAVERIKHDLEAAGLDYSVSAASSYRRFYWPRANGGKRR